MCLVLPHTWLPVNVATLYGCLFTCLPRLKGCALWPSDCLRHQATWRALWDRRQHGMEIVPMLCLWSGHVMVPSLTDVLLLSFSCSLWTGWGIRGEQAGHVHAKNDLIVPDSRGVGNCLWSISSTSQQLHSVLFFCGCLNAATEVDHCNGLLLPQAGDYFSLKSTCMLLAVVFFCTSGSDHCCTPLCFSQTGYVFIKCVPRPPGCGPTL